MLSLLLTAAIVACLVVAFSATLRMRDCRMLQRAISARRLALLGAVVLCFGFSGCDDFKSDWLTENIRRDPNTGQEYVILTYPGKQPERVYLDPLPKGH